MQEDTAPSEEASDDSSSDGEQNDKENGEEEEGEGSPENDSDDMQLAWQTLEVAKLIYGRQDVPPKSELAGKLLRRSVHPV